MLARHYALGQSFLQSEWLVSRFVLFCRVKR